MLHFGRTVSGIHRCVCLPVACAPFLSILESTCLLISLSSSPFFLQIFLGASLSAAGFYLVLVQFEGQKRKKRISGFFTGTKITHKKQVERLENGRLIKHFNLGAIFYL